MLALLLPLVGCFGTTDADSAGAQAEEAMVDPWVAAARFRTSDQRVPALEVEVTARVATPGQPATWTVAAGRSLAIPDPTPAPGTCRRAAEPATATPGADRIELLGPVSASLRWSPARGTWETEGPRRWLDPAWSISDLRWVDEAGAHTAEDVVRFGGLPEPTRVERQREGGVTVQWAPGSAAMVSVLAVGPAGALLCEVGEGTVDLPWWAVPAEGGAILLRSTREYTTAVDGGLVRVRATLERVVPLDQPDGTFVEEKPAAPAKPAPTEPGQRRVYRPRVIFG